MRASALMLAATLSAAALAQTQVIKGKIVDENGEPLVGVTIQEKGTKNGTITDIDGNYSIQAGARSTLQIRYVGYAEQDIAVGGKNVINVNLRSELEDLDEVVVVGYGAVKKRDLTGAVASVSGDAVKGRPVSNAMQALAGKVSGVQITQSQGAPGMAPTIKVRGASSITSGTTPLYVIDGIPLEDTSDSGSGTNGGTYLSNRNPMNSINPNDIESIEILKDASSAAIYGSRGANGVVLITTKSGKAGKTKVDATYEYGISKVLKKLDMMNAEQYMDYHNTARANSGMTAIPEFDPTTAYGQEWRARMISEGRDMQDIVFKTAASHNAQVQVSGGSEATQYMFSLGYLSQDGVVDQSDYKRLSARVNVNTKVNDHIDAGMKLSYANSSASEFGLGGKSDCVSLAIQSAPIFPEYDECGTLPRWNPNSIWYTLGQGVAASYVQFWHPYSLTREADQTKRTNNVLGNVFANIKIIDGLTFRSSANLSLEDWHRAWYWNTNQGYGYSFVMAAQADDQSFRTFNWAWENTLNYVKTIAQDHDITLLAGYTMQEQRQDYSTMTAGSFANDMVHTLNAGQVTKGSTTAEEWSLLSWLGRATYSYKGKYLASAAIRADGCSRFGKNNKWGYFPSGSVAWRINDESFMESTEDWLDNLKLRVSYGMTGNNNIGNYGAIGLLSTSYYAENGARATGYYTSTFPADDLKWEKTGQWNFGLDAGFIGRINLTADFYYSKTTDMLMSVPVPVLTGFTTSMQNIGELRNIGGEFSVNARIIDAGGFRWATEANLSFNRNKVLKLGNNDADIIVNTNDAWSITSVGHQVGEYYGYLVDGVLSTADMNNDQLPKYAGSEAGDPKVVDTNNDGKINADDRTYLGSYQPDFSWGWTNTFSYKGLELSIQLTGSHGFEIYNQNARYVGYWNSGRNLYARCANYWKSDAEPGDGVTFKPHAKETTMQSHGNSTWVEDGSFVRIKNIRLTYNLPKSILKPVHISDARLYVNLDNVHCFTDYSNYDPENSTFQTGYRVGLDYGSYPNPFTATFGVNLSF